MPFPARFRRALLDGSTVLLAMVALLAVVLPMRPAGASAGSRAEVEHRLGQLINAERSANGITPLRIDVRLVSSSRSWSNDMVSSGVLAHDGNLADEVPAAATRWAENVARTEHADAAAAIHEFFMSSPGHRANVLDPRFTDLGVGVAKTGGSTYATQRFTEGAGASVNSAVEPTGDVARALFSAGSAEHAVIVRDDAFPDALTAGPLAGRRGPVLFAPPGDVLHPSVRFTLEQTLPPGRTVYLVGGESAVSGAVERELSFAGWRVQRIAGGDRVETAVAVAHEVVERDGPSGTALLATAADWPDAAAGGAYAAAGGHPVLLAYHSELPAAVADFLGSQERVIALGGDAVLSDDVVARADAERVAGFSREATAAEVARQLWGYDQGREAASWWVVPSAGADAWAWALGAAPLAATQSAPVLLAGDPISEPLVTYLRSLAYGDGIEGGVHMHGPVPGATAATIRELLH